MHEVRDFRAAKSITAAAVDESSTVVSEPLILSSSAQGLAVCAEQTQTSLLLLQQAGSARSHKVKIS